MEKKSKKKIEIKKIIAILSCVLIISTVFIISCFAVDTINTTDYYVFNDNNFYSGTGQSLTLQISGECTDNRNNETVSFSQIQFAIYTDTNTGSHYIIELILEDNEGVLVKLVTNSTKQYFILKFSSISSTITYKRMFGYYLDIYTPPIDPYTPTANFLEWILNDTTTILGFMISNSVLLLVICIVIVSLSIGIIKRLTNKKF